LFTNLGLNAFTRSRSICKTKFSPSSPISIVETIGTFGATSVGAEVSKLEMLVANASDSFSEIAPKYSCHSSSTIFPISFSAKLYLEKSIANGFDKSFMNNSIEVDSLELSQIDFPSLRIRLANSK